MLTCPSGDGAPARLFITPAALGAGLLMLYAKLAQISKATNYANIKMVYLFQNSLIGDISLFDLNSEKHNFEEDFMYKLGQPSVPVCAYLYLYLYLYEVMSVG